MSINASQDNHYEEFLSDSTECPTCRGLGRIGKGNEELVALIPVTDSRLKPRKTVTYVLIAVLVCAIIGGLLLFFLIARSVTLDSHTSLIIPSVLYQENITHYLHMKYQIPINISNQNFLPVKVIQLKLSSMLYGEMLLNTSYNNTPLTVPMRTKRVHYVTVHLNSLGANDGSLPIVNSCQTPSPILWKLLMNFVIEANISYLSHTETTTVTLYNRNVCCHLRKGIDPDNPPSPKGIQCPAL